LSELNEYSENVYIYGDLNLDLLKCSSNKFVSQYVDILMSFGFLQLILKPTRIANNSATLIDHVLTNVLPNSCQTFILCNPISDHLPILHQIGVIKETKKGPEMLESRNFSDQNFNAFRTALINYSWNAVLQNQDTQSAFDSFFRVFSELYNIFFPIQIQKFNPNKQKKRALDDLGDPEFT